MISSNVTRRCRLARKSGDVYYNGSARATRIVWTSNRLGALCVWPRNDVGRRCGAGGRPSPRENTPVGRVPGMSAGDKRTVHVLSHDRSPSPTASPVSCRLRRSVRLRSSRRHARCTIYKSYAVFFAV